MEGLQLIWHIAKADFLERTRRYSFFVTLIATLYGASLFLPEKEAGYIALAVRGYRGLYNSHWVGLCVAVSTSLLLGLFGFYLVKNSIERDEKSRVGQLFAASPTDKLTFIIGKAMSNFLTLSVIVLATLLSAVAMFYLRSEAPQLEFYALIKPFILITLPTMLWVSAVALLFENLKWLKGGMGNVLYFFVWLISLIIPVKLMNNSGADPLLSFVDPFGFYKIVALINMEVLSLFPSSHNSAGLFSGAGPSGAKTFLWNGLDWTTDLYLGRLFWIVLSVLLVISSSVLFNRFDDSKEGLLRKNRKIKNHSKKNRLKDLQPINSEWIDSLSKLEFSGDQVDATPFAFVYILQAELKIMLKGLNQWWYIGLIVLNLLAVVIPGNDALKIILPLCWIFPIFIWSELGVREYKYRTSELVFSCVGTLKLQFFAMMLLGVIITVLSSVGPLIKLMMIGNQMGCISWVTAIFFIPFFATCCGVWSKTSRVFEGVYIVLWYIGPINGLAYFDFIGVVEGSAKVGMPFLYGTLAVLSLGLSLIQRKYFSIST